MSREGAGTALYRMDQGPVQGYHLNRMTDTTEKVTFPQLRWPAIKMSTALTHFLAASALFFKVCKMHYVNILH